MKKAKSQNRFLKRLLIWKKITRDSFGCDCESCKNIEENWMVIFDEQHAKTLYTTQCDFLVDWVALNYRDFKEHKEPKKKKTKKTHKECRYCWISIDIHKNMQYCSKEHSELWNKINKKKSADSYNHKYYIENKERILLRRMISKNKN